MAVQAKVAPIDQQVAQATERTVSHTLPLSESSNVALNIPPESVAGYSREGMDLVVQMQNGEVLRISNFYSPVEQPSQLFLVGEEEQLVAVDLAQATSDGILAASYAAESTLSGFTSLTSAAATTGGALGLGTAAMIGGVAIAGGVVVADQVDNRSDSSSNDGGGGTGGGGGGAENPVDTDPPAAASNLLLSQDSRFLTGDAEPGATVRVDVNGTLYSATADGDGRFTVSFDAALINGQTISVVVVDAAGNISAQASIVAPAITTPSIVEPSNGSELTGVSVPNATITMMRPDGTVLGQAIADADGNWSYTPSPSWEDGSVIDIHTEHPGGFRPPVIRIVIDRTAPEAPSVEASNGNLLSGTAEPNSTLTLTIGTNALVTVITDADGNWYYSPDSALSHDTEVTIVATDRAGNVSDPTTLRIDTQAPGAPSIDGSNGTVFSGTAEAGSTVILSGTNGSIGQALVDANGNWHFTASPAVANGSQVSVVARDAAGNTGLPESVVVNNALPNAPTIAASNGTVISGTATPGSTVVVTNSNGIEIGRDTTDGNGAWSITPTAPLRPGDGDVIKAVVETPQGTSASATLTIDAAAPQQPVVQPSNGSELTGTAEAGGKIILIYSNGQLIGQTTADADGNWSFIPTTPLDHLDSIEITVRDAVGNTSPPATVIIDRDPPPAPVVSASNGVLISGTAEAGSLVLITGPGGVVIGEVTATDGTWSYTPTVPLSHDTPLSVTARDAAGNISAPGTLVIDAEPPAAPTLDATRGTLLSGTAEPGSTVLITLNNAPPAVSVPVDSDGNWSYDPGSQLGNGTRIELVALDPSGNTSTTVTGSVDGEAPDTPTIAPSDGSLLSGTAEPGSTITVNLPDGSARSTTTAADGTWTLSLATPLSNGATVSVIATDAAGNPSPAASQTIDTTLPPRPTIDPSNGSQFSGTAAAGANVVLIGPDGQLGQTTADSNGNWAISVSPQLDDNTRVSATVVANGLSSAPAITVTDSVAPLAPTVQPSNGSLLSGSAEAGSTVIVTGPGGASIGQATANDQGAWTLQPSTPVANGTLVNAIAQDAAGNQSPVASTTIDSVAPQVPTIQPSTGTSLSGTAEPGSTLIVSDLSGRIIGQVAADGSGNWSLTPSPAVADNTTISVVARDAAGNSSAPASIIVDAAPPSAPIIDPSNGIVLRGSAEPGSTVTLRDAAGSLLAEATAAANGAWSAALTAQLPNGTQVVAVATDATGNASPSAIITVDGLPPAAPIIVPSNGSQLSGSAEAGSTVILTSPGGALIGQVIADASGSWTFTPISALGNGVQVSVVARDAAGNTSPASSVTIDNLAPGTPTLSPSNGTQLNGSGEAGSLLVISAGGVIIGQTVVAADGTWRFTPPTALPDGTAISIVARDATGNQSPAVAITIDALAPATPVLQPSNGSILSGTAEAGSTIILTGPGGVVIGQTTVDANGNWAFSPQNPLLDGTQVDVVARDSAGNTSPASNVIVDAVAPALPTLDASSGAGLLIGTAEPGSTVLLTIGNAAAVAVPVSAAGTWSYAITGQLAHDTRVSVVARDDVGNTSPAAAINIDAQAPAIPVLNASNGTQVSGTAEAGSLITVTGPNGFVQTTTAGPTGNWSITPSGALPDSALLTVTATDAVGNQSAAATVRVDATLPPRPSIAPSDGSELSGTAAPGATVELTDAAGTPIGQAIADSQGNWSFTPVAPLANGTSVNATVSAGGLSSAPATTVIDSVAPATPTINISNGTQLSGTAEAGSTVILSASGGVSIGQAVADASGNWTFTPTTAVANGTVVTAVAQDAAGNTSGPAATSIDALAPATPTIDASNGVQLGGSAEAGSTVVVTDASGRIIGQATATAEGTWALVPSPALPNGALISAVARDAAGNTSAAVSTTIDTIAPVAPTISPSNGIELSGTAEAGSTVIITGAGGTIIGQATADAAGSWSFTPGTAVTNGTQVSVVSQDEAGNTSPSASIVIDSQVPDHPTVNPSNGSLLTGTAEAGSTVIITGAGGSPIGSGTAIVDADGNWSLAVTPALAHGSLVNVVARDAQGNESAPAITLIDSVAPSAPVLNPSNGQTISGTAEAGSTVTIRVAGNSIGTAVADTNGNWTLTPGPTLSNATQISATATDAAGNISVAASATVDAQAPGVPTISASNGVTLGGTAEAGSMVIITGAGGAAIGQAVVDGAGNWSFIPPVALANNTQVSVVARDAAGNTSPSASVVVDAVAPNAPTVQPSNGVLLTGSAEAGSTVILTGPGGVVIGQTNAGPDGVWTFSPTTPLQHGALVSVSARDAAGNTGAPTSVTIDAVAPPAPTINATNGALLQGTAEAGSTLTLTANGNTLATLTVDASGTWRYTPTTTLANDTPVSVVSRDAAGNLSASASTRVDSLAPSTPEISASNGTELSGTSEPGSTVRLSVGGLQIALVTTDANGNWHFTPTTPLADNVQVTAIAVDAAGNQSGPATVTVDDAVPDLPIVAPSNGSLLSGTAEPGSTITIRINGQPDVQVTADPITGAWSSTFSPALANDTSVSVTATDATNNVSAPAIIVIDSQPPAVPTIQASNGTLLTGTAEAGSTVILTGPGGVPIGTTTANANGSWSLNPGTPLANGTVVTVVARDAASNISPSATTTIDNIAPTAPTIITSNGTVLSGSAEANSTVILTGPGGLQIGTTTANGSGAWTFAPSPALANGVVVTAVARDAAGNSSSSVSTTVDAVAPAAPTIQPSNGSLLSGTAEAGSTVTLTGAGGTPIGTAITNASGSWDFSPASALINGTVVNAVARDAAGNTSGSVSTTIDSVAPSAPTIQPSKGTLLTGTAEAGSTVILTGPGNAVIGQTTANASGAWSFTPGTALANGTPVTVVAKDAAGNTSASAATTIDSQAPNAPSNLFVTADGTLLTGNAEAGSQVRIVVNGNVANPITVTATAAGTFAAVLIPALVAGQPIGVTSIDAAGNVSTSVGTNAPNLSAPTISVLEAADTYINAAEAADGIQVRVGLAAGVRAGDVVTVTYTGTGTYQFNQAHTVTAAEALAGSAIVSVVPPTGSFPQGAASVTAHINNGANSQPASFTVDTIAPSSPVLSLVGNLLTISGEPNSEMTVRIDLGGTVATATVTTNNAGLASLNLLSGLNIGLSWDQLLSAQVSVSARDQAGNQSNVVALGLGASLQQQPLTLGNLAVDANLSLLNLPAARLGISGKTIAGAALTVEVITPLLNVTLTPLAADANGNFSVNLLSPNVLNQLGLSLSGLLNLGGDLALRITATSAGKTSGVYTVDLDPLGLLGLTIGNVRVDGTAADDILSGNPTIAGERIFAGDGNDLILNVGSGDRVDAGAGNDTIQIKATNFASVDGGAGFDTVVFDGGIDINYGAAGTGTFSNIERIDLGTGDSGSTLTLTAAAVNAMTDSRNTLQITGESNDVLNLTASALKTGAQQIDGITYDVYTYGSTTLLVEENTVQVVVS